MTIYLAVDAGGTKTEFLLADQTRELARVRTGTIKRMRTDDVTATHNLEAGLADLTLKSGIPIDNVASTCVGAAGASVPLVADWIRNAFAARVPGPLCLVGDVDIALDAAFEDGPGIVAIAGTGSNVAGRLPVGEVHTAGGWGPALSDQASGHRVGLEGLRALFLAIDLGRPSLLLQAVLDRWRLPEIWALVEAANRLPAPDFSELAPVIVACARQGDPIALAVLNREAQEMANLIFALLSRLRQSASDTLWLPPIAFAGSMLEHVPLLRNDIVAALHRELPELQISDGVVDPLLGALWRARSEAAHLR